MEWYTKVLKNYAVFHGRARRKEYWMFVLFNVIFSFAALIIDAVLGTAAVFYFLYAVAVLIPGLAVTVRRLHDVGKSGWMILITLIPLIGGIWLLVLLFTEGNPGNNEYGSNPKEVVPVSA